MNLLRTFGFATASIGLLLVTVGSTWQESGRNSGQSSNAPAKQETGKAPNSAGRTSEDPFAPVDDLHHFMEYVSQPGYKSLKEIMASEPTDRRVWRSIKSNAMILAETSALVASRAPEKLDAEQAKLWKQISLDVYQSGKAIYGANGDFAKARENYTQMIEHCNRCHQEFDNGKHQLEK